MQTRAVSLCLACAACLSVNAAAQSFSYADFSSTAGLVLNGSAAQNGVNLRMTPPAGGQAGTAWYQTQVPVIAGFSTTFAFQLSPVGGADGMTFTLHEDPNGTAALCGTGGSMAYTSEPLNPANTMQNCLVFELDTYNNGNFNDPSDNHISIHLLPTIPTTPNGADEYYSIAQATPPFDLNDGAVHTMCINYTPGTLEVYLDGAATPLITVPFDFFTGATTIGGNALAGLNLPTGNAYVGFTAGTGGVSQSHDVLAWSFGIGGCTTLVGPWETNNAASSLDLDGAAGTAYTAAVTTTCVGGISTMNSTATPGSLFDIAVTFTNAVPAALTTAGGQQVNLDTTHPSLFNFNGPPATWAGLLNLVPHPGAFTYAVPTASAFLGSAQQMAVDATHPDGFQLSQPIEINVVSGSGSVGLTLPDDGNVQIALAGSPLCANNGITFYGTVYNALYVNSNGDVSFTIGHGDFTATSSEWQTLMPRMGIQTDLEPNNYGTVTVTSNGFSGVGDWITVAYANVTEWGTGGNGVTSFNVEFHGPNGHEIGGFTTNGTWGATSVVGGISLGSAGTHPALVSFDALFGTGLQVNANATDSVIDENVAGMLLNANGWTSIQFPLYDGSSYIVQ